MWVEGKHNEASDAAFRPWGAGGVRGALSPGVRERIGTARRRRRTAHHTPLGQIVFDSLRPSTPASMLSPRLTASSWICLRSIFSWIRQLATDAARGAPLVRAFRFGLLAPGKSRIVIDLVRPACPGQVDAKPIVEGAPASRLKIELKPCDAAAFSTLDPLSAANGGSLDAAPSAPPPVVVLDPGHGGIDSGARGIGGVLEKLWFFSSAANSSATLRPRIATGSC